MDSEARRALPSVDRLVNAMNARNGELRHAASVAAARDVIEATRRTAAAGGTVPGLDTLADAAFRRLRERERPSLRRVINASGVLLQTNLGRAPLSDAAMAAMQSVGAGYSNLEFDLDEGSRGSRHEHVRQLIREATGAEDGMAVNNNAAALFFVLTAFANGREVVVSRGQAVEIGGGFRIPDVLRQSGARLVEVGTTNRTYARDYEEAIGEETAALLRVHASNFRIEGFVHEASVSAMSEIARKAGVLLLDDLGSGCLLDTRRWGMAPEPTVQESIAGGADLALFSGDKLLGGPQCGIIAGRTDLLAQLRKHPIARALRVDKTTIAALNATLRSYVSGTAIEDVPLWRMLDAPLAQMRRRAQRWARAAGGNASVMASTTMVGGGSLPGQGVETWCTAIATQHPDALQSALRTCDPPIVGRIDQDSVLLDPRGVHTRDDRYVESTLADLHARSVG
jgi:L-seryl-tRNA(Ser) seleniumtransferase